MSSENGRVLLCLFVEEQSFNGEFLELLCLKHGKVSLKEVRSCHSSLY